MPVGEYTRVGPKNRILDGFQIPQSKGQCWGLCGLLARVLYRRRCASTSVDTLGVNGPLTRHHTVLPVTHTFIHKWNESYLSFLPSCSALPPFGWYSFLVPLKVGGWVGRCMCSAVNIIVSNVLAIILGRLNYGLNTKPQFKRPSI